MGGNNQTYNSNEAIAEALLNHDRQVWEFLYRSAYDFVFSIIFSNDTNKIKSTSEEVATEAMVELYKRRLRNPSELKSIDIIRLIKGTCVNILKYAKKGEKKTVSIENENLLIADPPDDILFYSNEPEEATNDFADFGDIISDWENLTTPAQKIVLIVLNPAARFKNCPDLLHLSVFERLGHEAIAQQYSYTTRTVTSKIHQCKQKIRKTLEKLDDALDRNGILWEDMNFASQKTLVVVNAMNERCRSNLLGIWLAGKDNKRSRPNPDNEFLKGNHSALQKECMKKALKILQQFIFYPPSR